MKKILFIIIIIFLTGCSKYTDLKDLTIIKSIGIKYEDNYTIYAQVYDEIKKNVDPKTKVIEVDGKSIKEAFDNLKNKVDKEIFLSHVDLLILDENLTNNNFQEIIDYFIYNSEMRNDFLTIMSNEINELLTNTKYDEIETFIKTNNYHRNIINISFEEIANNYLEKKDFFITSINYDNYFTYQNYYFYNNTLKELNNEENRT